MIYTFLNPQNVDAYIVYLKKALREEPEKMTADSLDESRIRSRLNDPFYQHTKSILALENGSEKFS